MEPRFFHYTEIDSTNREAARLCAQGHGPWIAVSADVQTGGRGSYGRTWESPRGGLWMTVVVPPVFIQEKTRLYTDYAVQSVYETIGKHIPELKVTVKAPNDLLTNGRKICGVLAESAGAGGMMAVGLGLNVNLGPMDFPAELRSTATSLRIETGAKQDIKMLKQTIYQILIKKFGLSEQD